MALGQSSASADCQGGCRWCDGCRPAKVADVELNLKSYTLIARQDSERLAQVAALAGLDAAIPTCPGWTVAYLLRHMGGLAAGVADFLRSAEAPTEATMRSWFRSPPPDDRLIDWFMERQRDAEDALLRADPETAYWTFLPTDSPVEFWARRHAHETAIHRVDLELTAGLVPTAFDPAFAMDGIDELVAYHAQPGGALADAVPGLLRIHASDIDERRLIQFGAHSGTSRDECVVTGTASDLYVALWNRGSVNLRVEGRVDVLQRWHDEARWTFGITE